MGNPDCHSVRQGVQHEAHTLLGPGGNKPGAYCAGFHPEVDRDECIFDGVLCDSEVCVARRVATPHCEGKR